MRPMSDVGTSGCRDPASEEPQAYNRRMNWATVGALIVLFGCGSTSAGVGPGDGDSAGDGDGDSAGDGPDARAGAAVDAARPVDAECSHSYTYNAGSVVQTHYFALVEIGDAPRIDFRLCDYESFGGDACPAGFTCSGELPDPAAGCHLGSGGQLIDGVARVACGNRTVTGDTTAGGRWRSVQVFVP